MLSPMQTAVAATLHFAQLCRGADLHVAATAESKHKRHFWSLGEGFEGSTSDYTEYLIWGIGVIGVFYYLMNPNARRNLHVVTADERMHHPVDEFEQTVSDPSASSKKDD